MRKYTAECIGTAILVFMGCGSAVFLGCDAAGGHLAVALAFGLSIVATAYVIGGISGCHINPAVSLAMFLVKKLDAAELGKYIAAQVIGAVIGAMLLRMLVSSSGLTDLTGGLGSNGYASIGAFAGLLTEIVLTFIFIYTILGVTSDPAHANIAGVVIGLTLAFVHIVGIPLTGTSVNPARSIGPALFSGGSAAIAQLWVFIVGPLVGAALAASTFNGLNKKA